MTDGNRENLTVWVDIPVDVLDRAMNFYETVVGVRVERKARGDHEFGLVRMKNGNGACLVHKKELTSDTKGILVYFNVDGRIRDAVSRVDKAGGNTIVDVHSIEPYGFRAIIVDSEGNRIAVHSWTDA